MAGQRAIFRLYETSKPQLFLFRLIRPDYANWSQSAEEEAYRRLNAQDMRARQEVSSLWGKGLEFNLVGEMQFPPPGDALYSHKKGAALHIFWVETNFGHPWIILGQDQNEEDFWHEITAEDEDLAALQPKKPVHQATVCFWPMDSER